MVINNNSLICLHILLYFNTHVGHLKSIPIHFTIYLHRTVRWDNLLPFSTVFCHNLPPLSLSSNEFTHLGYDKVLFSAIYPQVFSSAAHLMNNK